MLRSQLEHVLRASGSIVDEEVMIVIGSQAILASDPDPPAELTVSAEADLYPRDAPEKADLITGSIGEFSMFHETFGYHVDGVSPTTAVLPRSWRERLVPLRNENTGGVTGLCLSPVDIAISKLAAGRKKDLDYVSALLKQPGRAQCSPRPDRSTRGWPSSSRPRTSSSSTAGRITA